MKCMLHRHSMMHYHCTRPILQTHTPSWIRNSMIAASNSDKLLSSLLFSVTFYHTYNSNLVRTFRSSASWSLVVCVLEGLTGNECRNTGICLIPTFQGYTTRRHESQVRYATMAITPCSIMNWTWVFATLLTNTLAKLAITIVAWISIFPFLCQGSWDPLKKPVQYCFSWDERFFFPGILDMKYWAWRSVRPMTGWLTSFSGPLARRNSNATSTVFRNSLEFNPLLGPQSTEAQCKLSILLESGLRGVAPF